MPDAHQTGLRWRDYEFSAPAAPFPVDAVRPPPSYPDPVYLRIPGRGTALVSDPIDRALPGPYLGRCRTATLQDILRRGMHRELREETAIRPDEIKGTTVTGFARWLDRGAKPEFFGLTQLSVTEDDLAGRRALAPGERPYSEGTLTARIDLDALGRELDSGADLLTAPSLPGRIREDGSLPLLLALRAAALWRARSAARDHALG